MRKIKAFLAAKQDKKATINTDDLAGYVRSEDVRDGVTIAIQVNRPREGLVPLIGRVSRKGKTLYFPWPQHFPAIGLVKSGESVELDLHDAEVVFFDSK